MDVNDLIDVVGNNVKDVVGNDVNNVDANNIINVVGNDVINVNVDDKEASTLIIINSEDTINKVEKICDAVTNECISDVI